MVSHIPSLSGDNSRRYGILFFVFCSMILSRGVFAQIQPPAIIGINSSLTSGTSISISVPAAGVSLGKTILVTVAMDPSSTAVSITDTRGNTYTKDADVTNGSVASGVRTLIFSAPVSTALVSANSITVSFATAVVTKAVSAFSVSGLVAGSLTDKSSTATGNSTIGNSGIAPTTSQPDELLFGVFGLEDKSSSVTFGPGFSPLTSNQTNSGSGTANIGVFPGYRVVSATGGFSAPATVPAVNWAAALVTYKIDVPAIASISRATASPSNATSVSFNVAFSENVTGVDATDFSLASTGVTGASISGVTGSNSSYTVNVNTGSGNGTIGLNIIDNESVKDADNIPLGGTGAGNGNFTGEIYTIDKSLSTQTSLASSQNPSAYAQSVTFTATVITNPSSANIPTGTVTFYSGSTPLGSEVTLNASGVATLNTSSLEVNTSGHSITAVYTPAGNFITSTSSAVLQQVNKATASISLAGLSQTYDGTARSVTATTTPAGLTGISITYDGSSTAPTIAGSYAVVASLTNANYAADNATGNLVIGKASAS
ncbi:MBG domain-containing protein, partial [Pedobacter sp. P351]|uniref:MBG domain-containing protein n=1 Tax=Pedobacter superstes TaxID=3133441 RepID=UPI0030B7101B